MGPTTPADALPARRGQPRRNTMGKTGRKRRARRKNSANHGKRPNS